MGLKKPYYGTVYGKFPSVASRLSLCLFSKLTGINNCAPAAMKVEIKQRKLTNKLSSWCRKWTQMLINTSI